MLSRRPDSRISPPRSSTHLLSSQPVSSRDRTPVGETERLIARDLVMGRLKDAQAQVRDAAILALGKSGYKEAVPFLAEAASNDVDPQVREDALLALGLSGQRDAALPVLLKALDTPSTDKRERRAAFAALGLGLLGDRENAAPRLRDLYKRAAAAPNMADEAACTAVALGMLGDAEAIAIFEKFLASSATPESVKVYTLHALGKYGTADEKVARQAQTLVTHALKDRKQTVKRAAVLALGSFSESYGALIAEGLDDSDPYTKGFAAASLGRIAARMDPSSREYKVIAAELAKSAEGEKKDRWLSQASNIALAGMAYGDHEKFLMDAIKEGLTKINPHNASSVVLSLGLLGTDSPAARKALEDALRSRGSGTSVQAYSGLALAMAGAPKATEELRGVLTSTVDRPPADVARSLALGLGLVGGKQDVDLLIGVLKGERFESFSYTARHFIRGTSVIAIGLIADAETVKKVQPLLTSPREWEQRAFATAVLGYLLEPSEERRVSPRIGEIFRHHNYTQALPVVQAVQSIL